MIARATEERIFKIEMTKQRLLEIKSAVVDNYGKMMEKQRKLKEFFCSLFLNVSMFGVVMINMTRVQEQSQ